MTLRWTKLRILLLVTGLLSGVLFVSSVAADETGLVGDAVATGFALSLVAFLLLVSVGLGKRALRDARKVYRQRVAKCSICDEPLPEASLRQAGRLHAFHYETVHPDAWRWSQKWLWKLSLSAIVPSIILFTLGTYIVLGGNYLGFAVMVLAVVQASTFTWLRTLKLRQFRSNWATQRNEV